MVDDPANVMRVMCSGGAEMMQSDCVVHDDAE
jgi:hypothetical protein